MKKLIINSSLIFVPEIAITAITVPLLVNNMNNKKEEDVSMTNTQISTNNFAQINNKNDLKIQVDKTKYSSKSLDQIIKNNNGLNLFNLNVIQLKSYVINEIINSAQQKNQVSVKNGITFLGQHTLSSVETEVDKLFKNAKISTLLNDNGISYAAI